MKLLDDYEIELFEFNEIENQINRKFDNLNEILENLVHKELLSRIERGKFCKVNFRDENVIGTFVVKNSAVAYWSALNLHGLTQDSYDHLQIDDLKQAAIIVASFVYQSGNRPDLLPRKPFEKRVFEWDNLGL